jgi:hypothetical protein
MKRFRQSFFLTVLKPSRNNKTKHLNNRNYLYTLHYPQLQLQLHFKQQSPTTTTSACNCNYKNQDYGGDSDSGRDRGEPRWEGSEAVRLLRLDMDEGKHHTMRPRDLYQTRPQYYEKYPLTVFRGHIDQEERRRKYFVFLKKKQAGR